MAKTVLIAHAHKLFREGLRELMGDRLDVIAEAPDGRAAVRLAKELHPDIVIMAVALPGLNGVEATRQITEELPDVRIVGLSEVPDWQTASRMLQAGAFGYLLRADSFDELEHAIQAVLAGQIYLTAGVETKIVRAYCDQLSTNKADSPLTPRAREVLQLLAEGKTVRQIAEVLYISVKTVETHRKQIMDKLKLHSIAELTKYAIREGITPL